MIVRRGVGAMPTGPMTINLGGSPTSIPAVTAAAAANCSNIDPNAVPSDYYFDSNGNVVWIDSSGCTLSGLPPGATVAQAPTGVPIPQTGGSYCDLAASAVAFDPTMAGLFAGQCPGLVTPASAAASLIPGIPNSFLMIGAIAAVFFMAGSMR